MCSVCTRAANRRGCVSDVHQYQKRKSYRTSLPPLVFYGTLTGTGGCTHRSSRDLTEPAGCGVRRRGRRGRGAHRTIAGSRRAIRARRPSPRPTLFAAQWNPRRTPTATPAAPAAPSTTQARPLGLGSPWVLPITTRPENACTHVALPMICFSRLLFASAFRVNRALDTTHVGSDLRHASLHRRQLQRDRIDAQMLAKQLIDLHRQGRVRWRRAHHTARLPDCIWDAERRVQLQERADLVDPLHECYLRRRRQRG